MRRSRKRPYGEPHVPLDIGRARGGTRVETGPGGRQFTVRVVRSVDKTYRCPGCNGNIPPGLSHVVAWSDEHIFGADAALANRRHWHDGCWSIARRRGW